MNPIFCEPSKSGASRQRKGKGTARDVKKKLLNERRKPLNIDHMDVDKLRTKCQELFDCLRVSYFHLEGLPLLQIMSKFQVIST